MTVFLFYLFGAGALLAGANVVLRRRAVPAAVWLVVCFFFLAGEFLLLGAPFLAAVQVMVYVGAIMVLFLFVIMLLDVRGPQGLQGRVGRGTGVALAAVIVATAASAAAAASSGSDAAAVPGLDAIVETLFTTWLLPFEVTSVLLVAAIVGALTLGRSEAAGRRPPAGTRAVRLESGDPPARPADQQAEAAP